ncbi:regulatory protein RecX [Mobiluncus mulieris ATCC 35239]|uniref:Regulatory protein RecX n=1 Tax=Mobiluncus mulieris ATCC 35239 TaxID=871571 RepID=E0QQW6_9ACTO|nr:regulatory protein RecX [Mobiluncus mulieris]EFM45959.1 regulatory protein RecX [Mobiluncus mulieris ATCC 35239]MCU9970946.1 regulatory protein RecX [Mobiluncus mulieris]MCU9975301.1 regulatory protein RecX [Mobiluncus mulieris]MCU9993318.1 regulatory protein RecX [Mobiluncus mulieris]MCV0013623.1 regulatory protein RecX [Mobiluncus mulieris]
MSLHLVASAAPDAAEAGLKLLDRRAVTETQMRQHLAGKGFEAAAVNEAVALFTARGWIADGDYAGELVRQRFAKPGLSRAKLRADMEKRGLDSPEVDAALAALDQEFPQWEAQNAWNLLKGKLVGARRGLDLDCAPDRRKLQAKLWRYLATRGFDSDISRQAVRRVLDTITEAPHE